jgi:tetratricopeptide (TPR) repeat protein
MEFVEGRSLGAEIQVRGRLPWQEVAGIGAQVADALAHAHAAGIVHRDLKPANILLSGRRAVVADFGIARVLDATTGLTSTGVAMGTPLYMAPEQFDGADVNAPADMWALGATLYAAVEGTPPFSQGPLPVVMNAILTRSPPRPGHAGPLGDLIESLLDRDPGGRPGPGDVAAALADAAGEASRAGKTAERRAESGAAAREHFEAGSRHYKNGDLAAAEAAYRQVIAIKPGDPDARNNLGLVLADMKRLPEAEAEYREAIRLRPDVPNAYPNLGALLVETGRPQDAEAACRQGIANRPGDGTVQPRPNSAALSPSIPGTPSPTAASVASCTPRAAYRRQKHSCGRPSASRRIIPSRTITWGRYSRPRAASPRPKRPTARPSGASLAAPGLTVPRFTTILGSCCGRPCGFPRRKPSSAQPSASSQACQPRTTTWATS